MGVDFRDTLRALLDNGGMPVEEAVGCEPDAVSQASGKEYMSKARLDIFFEKKGRGGKKATIIAGFPDGMDDDDIATLASGLKQKLGAGGSARGGEILIQGDRRADLKKALEELGWKVRVC
ncbi:translation initiation factor [Muribaculum intestinale]|uniref:translation initiation factor n=1 Tax=Muribaculum intestinale TaxID=1796646 RepID=UPI00242CAB96|nr:translation initiation factor [Muribaculum intestinale]